MKALAFTHAGWKSMEKRLPVALRAPARFKSAKKGRRDAEDAEVAGAREGELFYEDLQLDSLTV